MREAAAQAGITERAAHRVVAELEAAGYLTRHRFGHRNFYELHPDTPLQEPLMEESTLGDLLTALASLDSREPVA